MLEYAKCYTKKQCRAKGIGSSWKEVLNKLGWSCVGLLEKLAFGQRLEGEGVNYVLWEEGRRAFQTAAK